MAVVYVDFLMILMVLLRLFRVLADEISGGAFGGSKDTVDASRGVFGKANGSGISGCTKLSTCWYTS